MVTRRARYSLALAAKRGKTRHAPKISRLRCSPPGIRPLARAVIAGGPKRARAHAFRHAREARAAPRGQRRNSGPTFIARANVHRRADRSHRREDRVEELPGASPSRRRHVSRAPCQLTPRSAAAKRRLAEHPGARLAGGLCSGANVLTSILVITQAGSPCGRLRAMPAGDSSRAPCALTRQRRIHAAVAARRRPTPGAPPTVAPSRFPGAL